MTEKEKMLNGELYNPSESEELINEQGRAKDLCWKFNSIRPSEINKRIDILKNLIGNYGKNLYMEQPFWCDYGYNIKVGDNFYANHNTVMLDAAKIEFGDFVFIGPNCSFYTSFHPLDYRIRNTNKEGAKEIKIGNNVWIGGNVVVLPGVTIGDNVVIGAGSIVTKDIPSNVVAVGNPCKVLKSI